VREHRWPGPVVPDVWLNAKTALIGLECHEHEFTCWKKFDKPAQRWVRRLCGMRPAHHGLVRTISFAIMRAA